MKMGQIDVLFAVTRTKKKRRVTYKDSFVSYTVILHYILKKYHYRLPGISFSS